MKQMIQAASINFKSVNPRLRRKLSRKVTVGLWVIVLIPTIYFYCRYLDRLTHVRVAPKGSHTAPAAAPVADKPKLAASLPKPDGQPALVKTNNQVTPKAAEVGFIDSLMSVISPSARAATLPPTIQPAPKPVVQTASRASSSLRMQPVTAEQKQLKAAQEGFGDAMNLAYQYPDRYGFSPEENLRAARLGKPIPVYQVVQSDRAHYMGQPVTSMLKPAEEWLYPIVLDNRIRFMVQVRCVGRDYVLGNGSRALAMLYEKILARWPASEGFHPQLVMNPNMPFYYFTIPELPEENITDTSRMLESNPSLSPAAVILESWR